MKGRKLGRLSCWEQVSSWKDMEQEEMGKKKRTMGNETTMLLTGLDGNTQYLISVKGFNSVGQGPASSPIKISTKKNGEFPWNNSFGNIINYKIKKHQWQIRLSKIQGNCQIMNECINKYTNWKLLDMYSLYSSWFYILKKLCTIFYKSGKKYIKSKH